MVKTRDLITAIVVVVLVFLPLAWPWHLEFSYWAESPVAWALFVLVGASAAVYVLFVFLQRTRRLMAEEEEPHE